MVLGPRRRAWRSCRRRSTSPLAGDLLPAMAPRGNPPRPPAMKEGGRRATTELEEGAATSLAGRRGRQIRLPPPRAELEAAGSGQSRRIPAAQASASAAAMEGNWKKEQERAESQASQLRRYARDRARARGGTEQTHPRPP